MDIAQRPVRPLPRRFAAAFVGLFLALYAGAAGIAEVTVARAGQDTAMQKLLALRGQDIDWVVLGASHALPLAFGDVPGRLERDTGQTMAVLAETGAGPLYNTLVFRQALRDVSPERLLYVVDSFAFTGPRWNEDRLSDRKLLRQTPLRASTASIMAEIALGHGAGLRGLADYLTAFSKLNPPDRFPQAGWRGEQDFDTQVKLSRHAVSGRIAYLYPEADASGQRNAYLDILIAMFEAARARGIDVAVVKLPMPEPFLAALPGEDAFDAALRARLAPLDIPYHDLGGVLPETRFYFDTDHLNQAGVDALYSVALGKILSPGPGPDAG